MGEAVEERIKAVLAGVLANGTEPAEIPHDADLVDEYGVDSLQMISFLLGIEDEFDVELDYDNLELDDLRSVRQFGRFVTGLVPAAS
ncbi:acyl carrier protein [Umezawaea endophytica]|uniref:Acyl carrier protein n=1 Tax=Umezawaea endophytica TaxID=1654476 RepID=A0A9X2VKJ8_9PSEU|nr:acyl carrier protein [Umezawaea endophytica]MCS7476858.1 acyl carrier protein [Umezawaea endophytica]